MSQASPPAGAPLIECVPNFSEGRRPEVIDAIAAAIEAVDGALVLDRSLDADHNRAVVTFVAPPETAPKAALAAARVAADRIDLTAHEGVHPRMGATDVIPFVPLRGTSMNDCIDAAHRAAQTIAEELDIPCFLYGEAADSPYRVNLADVRRPRFEGLGPLLAEGDEMWSPDYGPSRLHPTAGATAVGARFFLIAFNVDLTSDDLDLAKRIARAVRASSGGLPEIKALGLRLPGRGRVQVSMNVCDYRVTSLLRVFREVERLAAEAGVAIAGSELIGLVPEAAWSAVATEGLHLPAAGAGGPAERVIEARIARRQEQTDPPMSAILAALGSAEPTPGGGFAASLCGALGAALGAMCGRITAPRIEEERDRAIVDGYVQRLDAYASRLRELADRDAVAYEKLRAARRIPRSAPDRASAIEAAARYAAQVPLDVAGAALDVAEIAVKLGARSSKYLAADIATAASLASVAAASARWMVLMNVQSLSDKNERHGLCETALTQVDQADAIAQRARVIVERELDPGTDRLSRKSLVPDTDPGDA